MDNPKESPTLLSFCTGYGGLDKGIASVVGSVSPLACVEIEAFAIANLVDKMETGQMAPCPIFTDVKKFPSKIFRGYVDILVAGYPCQPFSAAGKRKGTEDPRHLWPFIREHIRKIKPTLCFFENVEGHISLGLSTVLSDLEEDGYTTTWGIFSAVEVGAPHQRKRVFILAHSKQSRLWERLADRANRDGVYEQIKWEDSVSVARGGEKMADTLCGGLQGLQWGDGVSQKGWKEQDGQVAKRCNLWPARPGEEQYEWEKPRCI